MAEATLEEDKSLLPSYINHNGFLMSKGFPIEGFNSGLQYKAQREDVFVATYAKCGTTWMQNIVYLILNNGQPVPPEANVDKIFPHLEAVGADYVSKRPTTSGFRLIKSHLPYSLLPQNLQAKYIFVIRNPKDCVVSFYHHTKGFIKHYDFARGSFDTFFDLFYKGKVDFNSYFDYLRSWMDHRNDENVLFLTYEEMKMDTRGVILKVAEFLDKNVLPARLLDDNEKILNLVLEHSSLKSMKKDPQRWSSERPKEHAPFIRKGSMGGWDELLSEEQVHLLDQKMRDEFTAEEIKILGSHY